MEKLFGRGRQPWSEEAEEDKDNGEEVAEKQFEEDVQGVHGVPEENSLETKVFFSLDNQTLWRECRRPDQRRPQWTWWKVGSWFEIKRHQDLDLMKSSGMAGRTVMTTRESRRYLHS